MHSRFTNSEERTLRAITLVARSRLAELERILLERHGIKLRSGWEQEFHTFNLTTGNPHRTLKVEWLFKNQLDLHEKIAPLNNTKFIEKVYAETQPREYEIVIGLGSYIRIGQKRAPIKAETNFFDLDKLNQYCPSVTVAKLHGARKAIESLAARYNQGIDYSPYQSKIDNTAGLQLSLSIIDSQNHTKIFNNLDIVNFCAHEILLNQKHCMFMNQPSQISLDRLQNSFYMTGKIELMKDKKGGTLSLRSGGEGENYLESRLPSSDIAIPELCAIEMVEGILQGLDKATQDCKIPLNEALYPFRAPPAFSYTDNRDEEKEAFLNNPVCERIYGEPLYQKLCDAIRSNVSFVYQPQKKKDLSL